MSANAQNGKIIEIELAANIRWGRCTNCGEDLTDLLVRVEKNELPLPTHCRKCGRVLQPPMMITIYYCNNCKTNLTLGKPNPERERFCSTCGEELDYSSLKKEENEIKITGPKRG